jgi:hypothetical protein
MIILGVMIAGPLNYFGVNPKLTNCTVRRSLIVYSEMLEAP